MRLLCFALLYILHKGFCQNNGSIYENGNQHITPKRKELKRIRNEVHPYIRFTDDYSNKKMPLNSLPLDVNLTINIKNIYGVDEVSQLLGMETTVQMNWIDDRITLLDVAKEHINLDRITLPPDVSSFIGYTSKGTIICIPQKHTFFLTS